MLSLEASTMQQHFILCGLGRVGARVLEYLRAVGAEVVVIDNRCEPGEGRLRGARLVRGDCRRQELLREAGVDHARGVLVLTSDDLVNISTALTVRHLRRDLRVVVRMFNPNLLARLGKALENMFALSTSALTAPVLALIARTGELLGAFRLEDGCRQQVTEVEIHPNAPLRGRRVAEVAAGHEARVLAHLPAAGPPRFLQDVDPERPLGAGDRVVLCGAPRKLAPLVARAEQEGLPELLWAGKLRRLGRMVRRTLGEVDLAVKICTSVLLGVILVSTATFYFSTKHDGLDGALYRTISLIATGADMRGRELEEPWQKVFVSVLRLVGAALIAAFTAILTNYLVRAHLRGALEVRRIPERGHVVVCGLGNVGFRLVEELLAEGEQVVAVEWSRDNPFIATGRRLGAAVMVGDATVAEVLRQANTAGARAVVACTDNELANLEIALLVRDLKPTQRVVVRLSDPHLAQTLREAADVRFALSIPELAAPAFVAALFGDRVRSVFFVEDRLLAVVDLVVQPQDPFLEGQAVRALAVDYGLLPLRLQVADGSVRLEPLPARLGAGDRLTAVVSLGDLQRLLQREKAPREYAVEVTACPPLARPFLAQLARTAHALSAEAAEGMVERVPFCLQEGLTRGQAEDLLVQLQCERVAAQLRRAENNGAADDSYPAGD
jgi:Trk K+ transport system NAD-binding subunit